MIKNIARRLLQMAHLTRKEWVDANVLDKPYRAIKGSVRTRHDKDDAWLFALGRESNVIFDIGSNIGQAALMLLYHQDIKHIVLVDPNPKALSIAAENLIHNNLAHKARFVCAFISDTSDQEVEFYTQDSGAAGSRYRSFAKTADKLDAHYKVRTLTVDFLVKNMDLIPDLVKIDVEGAEREALLGATHLAARKTARFFVEIHSGPELSIEVNTQGILGWCATNGYTAWYLRTKQPLTLEAVKSRGRYHALLLPDAVAFPQCLANVNENDPLK
jgi:FkbM family methyltransferase